MADQTPRDEAKALYDQMTVVDLQAELGERKFAKTGNKDELVARLLDADFPPAGDGATEEDPAASDPPPDEAAAEDGELCAVCWPDGWPSPDTNNASCEHGVWDR